MKSSIRIKTALQNLFSQGKNRRRHIEYDAVHDWIYGLCVAFLLSILGVTYIGYDFYTQFYTTPSLPETTQQTSTYRIHDIESLSTQYTERQKEFMSLRNTTQAPETPQTQEQSSINTTDTGTTTEHTQPLADTPIAQ